MALQVVSILSSSKGALEVDGKELPDSQKQADHRGGTDIATASPGTRSKFQQSRLNFGKTHVATKPASGSDGGEGGGGVRGEASGEVTPLNKYFRSFMVELLRMFDTDRSLLDTKGSFVIR